MMAKRLLCQRWASINHFLTVQSKELEPNHGQGTSDFTKAYNYQAWLM
jgi:hypothetical protein